MTYTPPEVEPSRPTAPAPAPKTSGHAIAGLLVGLGGLCTCGVGGIAGLVLSIVALKKIDASGGTLGGRGLAIAGIIASAVCILIGLVIGLGVLVAFLTAAQSGQSALEEPRVGGVFTTAITECFEGKADGADDGGPRPTHPDQRVDLFELRGYVKSRTAALASGYDRKQEPWSNKTTIGDPIYLVDVPTE